MPRCPATMEPSTKVGPLFLYKTTAKNHIHNPCLFSILIFLCFSTETTAGERCVWLREPDWARGGDEVRNLGENLSQRVGRQGRGRGLSPAPLHR